MLLRQRKRKRYSKTLETSAINSLISLEIYSKQCPIKNYNFSSGNISLSLSARCNVQNAYNGCSIYVDIMTGAKKNFRQFRLLTSNSFFGQFVHPTGGEGMA